MACFCDVTETSTLTGSSETAFSNFISSVWTGTLAGVESVDVWAQVGTVVKCQVNGTKTVSDPGLLPSPPVNVTRSGSNYTFQHTEMTALNASQKSLLATFYATAWSGSTDDVTDLKVIRAAAGSGGLRADVRGTIEYANPASVPEGQCTCIIEIT